MSEYQRLNDRVRQLVERNTELGEECSALLGALASASADRDDLKAMIAENEKLRQLPTRNALIKARDQLIDERDQLKAENESLRKDAARFAYIEQDADSGMSKIYGDDWISFIDAAINGAE